MLTDHSRSLIEAATLASRPEFRQELLECLRLLRSHGVVNTEELYEVFLQTYLFAGFPAALESVRALEKVFGQPKFASTEEISNTDYSVFFAQGNDLYQRVYATNAPKVRAEMLRLSPELAAWAMIEGYGKTLSRPGLDSKERELCIVAQLTQLGWERQLFSHILGARNVGASIEEITEAARIGSRCDEIRFGCAEQLIKKLV